MEQQPYCGGCYNPTALCNCNTPDEVEGLKPCPRCKGEVEWTNSRDLDILTSRVECTQCELSVFHVDTLHSSN